MKGTWVPMVPGTDVRLHVLLNVLRQVYQHLEAGVGWVGVSLGYSLDTVVLGNIPKAPKTYNWAVLIVMSK